MEEKPRIELYYDMKSKTFDDTFDNLYFKIYDEITWRHIEPYVPTEPDSVVLDAGGGTGRWSVPMARKGCSVILMDLSEKMLRIAKSRVRNEDLQDKISIRKGDITETGFPDEFFNMVLCEHTLFLFGNPDSALMELRRVLKKAGRLIISVHNRYVQCLASLAENPTPRNLENAFRILSGKDHHYLDKQRKVKIFTWTPDEFRNILKKNGFKIEKIIGKGFSMPLRISKHQFMKKDSPKDLLNELSKFELALSEKPDALALAGILQAIVQKS